MTKTILKALIDQDITRSALAERIGRSRVYTSNVINGRFSKPPLATIKLIADVLGIPVEELLATGKYRKRAA
jgi:transcriptional regulator with XRE-family HTH domain